MEKERCINQRGVFLLVGLILVELLKFTNYMKNFFYKETRVRDMDLRTYFFLTGPFSIS